MVRGLRATKAVQPVLRTRYEQESETVQGVIVVLAAGSAPQGNGSLRIWSTQVL